MCGIIGTYNPAGPAGELSVASLGHRGPDGSGHWRSPDGHVWLGHTRLAIIDLSSAGAQPMLDTETGNVLVFNGEIYNHLSIRAELAGLIKNWRGTSDTETILRAFPYYGTDLFSRLKGMFALVIYDAQAERLVAARDRFGIKPFYYTSESGVFAFASEVRALAHTRNTPPTQAAISAYLRLGVSPEELPVFPGVRSLPAAHLMTVEKRGAMPAQKYWSPPGPEPLRPSRVEAPAQRIRTLLERSVDEHLLADVPVASFLSGGIDSSVLTAMAAQRAQGRLATFSVGFPQQQFDESAVAETVARRFKTNHTRIDLDESEVIAMVTEAVAAMDLPSVDAINTYVVSKSVVRKGIKVALSGLGGDELFGGYPSFKDVPRLAGFAGQIRPWMRPVLRHLGGLARRIADVPATTDYARLADWRRMFWSEEMLASAGLPAWNIEPAHLPLWADAFAQISWTELSHYMRHTLLRDSDQMSMAVGLELRVPFLDHELVEYVLSLPQESKKRYAGVKGLLVEATRDLLPTSVYTRPKMGFGLPMDNWMRGPLAAFATEGLEFLEETNRIPSSVLRLMSERFRTRSIHWTRLWSLVVLGHYMKRNLQPCAVPSRTR